MNLTECLKYIDPASLDYQTWVNVGMALKQEGLPCSVWDDWSRSDSRYHSGECAKKWESFGGNPNPVTGATIVQLAKRARNARRGKPRTGLGRRDIIRSPGGTCRGQQELVGGREINPPADWNPAREITATWKRCSSRRTRSAMSCRATKRTEVHSREQGAPTTARRVSSSRTCRNAEAMSALSSGDYNPRAGAWIRFNPLDGRGIKNENVTEVPLRPGGERQRRHRTAERDNPRAGAPRSRRWSTAAKRACTLSSESTRRTTRSTAAGWIFSIRYARRTAYSPTRRTAIPRGCRGFRAYSAARTGST